MRRRPPTAAGAPLRAPGAERLPASDAPRAADWRRAPPLASLLGFRDPLPIILSTQVTREVVRAIGTRPNLSCHRRLTAMKVSEAGDLFLR